MTQVNNTAKKRYPKRGFGSMPKSERTRIAQLGGLAAHAAGTAHEWTSDEASAAGKKGGLAAQAKRRAKKQPASLPVETIIEDILTELRSDAAGEDGL